MIIPNELSIIVSSDPSQGAVNRSENGDYFEIQLQDDGISIDRDALNVTLSVEESIIWWSVPNIITGKNDKMYITGSSESKTTSYDTMGFDADNTLSITGALLDILQATGGPLPVGAFIVGDIINIETGTLSGQSFEIVNINSDQTNQMNFDITPTTENQTVGNWTFSRTRPGIATDYIISIPQGLYDLSGLNQAISRELETQGALTDPNPLITLASDEATQKVEIRFNYSNVSVDFTQPNTFAEILGFNLAVYGPYISAPLSILAPITAAFNQINYFLIHSDLTNKGIRFNNTYNQTVSQVLIDTPPGSQITSQPFNPARINVQELAGSTRTVLRFWLTDDQNRSVNTNNEYWSARIVIRYLKPYVIAVPR